MNPSDDPLPPACDVAFKEWATVCAAVADGRQAILLRKGGIAETSGEFRPEHPVFWLYPTFLHQAEQGVRTPGTGPPPPPAGRVDLGILVRVAGLGYVDRLETLDELADLHVWTAETIRARYHYRRPGLWLLAIRAYRREPPHQIAEAPGFAGCKSWVPLPEPLATTDLAPVVGDGAFAALLDRVRPILGPAPSPTPGTRPAP